jgi:hypothetical protein
MTPENLDKGNELNGKIESSISPIEKCKKADMSEYLNGVCIGNMNNSHYSITFYLKKNQLEILRVIILSMAEQNLKELQDEFANLE